MVAEFIRKFKFKAQATVLHAPESLVPAFVDAGFQSQLTSGSKVANVLVFVHNRSDLDGFLQRELSRVAFDAVLWIAYPKGSGGVQTDINRDSIRTIAEGFGITTVTAISIDTTWSALRFRPIEQVGK